MGADISVSPTDQAAQDALERDWRARVQQHYARQGIASVTYDLQII